MKNRLMVVVLAMAMVFNLSGCSLAKKDGVLYDVENKLMGIYITTINVTNRSLDGKIEGKILADGEVEFEALKDIEGIAYFRYESEFEVDGVMEPLMKMKISSGVYDIGNKLQMGNSGEKHFLIGELMEEKAVYIYAKLMIDSSKLDGIYIHEVFQRPDDSIYINCNDKRYSVLLGSEITVDNEKMVYNYITGYSVEIKCVGEMTCQSIKVYNKADEVIDTLKYEDVKDVNTMKFSEEMEYIIVETEETDYNGSIEVKRAIYNRVDGEFVVLNSTDNGIVNYHTVNFK